MDARQELINHEIEFTEKELKSKKSTAHNTTYKALKKCLQYGLQKDDEYDNSKNILSKLTDVAVEKLAERLLEELVEGGRIASLKDYKDQKGKTMLRLKMLENISLHYK